MEANALTGEMILVLFMIGLAILLFVMEWIRVDMVAILMTISLPLLGLVTPKEAFSGFSSNAVISIIAVIIIGAGLDKTGLINRVVDPIVKLAGNSSSRVIIFMGSTVAIISSFMQNIGAAALFLPAIKRVSKTLNISLSQLLMPIGFCAIIGGTVTLVGSSPLILLNDLLAPYELEPFRLFDVTPIGLALVGSGILYFIVMGRFVLPKGSAKEQEESRAVQATPAEAYEGISLAFELKTPEDFGMFMDPLTVKDVKEHYLLNVVAISARDKIKLMTLTPEMEIGPDNDLAVIGLEENVRRLARDYGLEIKPELEVFKDNLAQSVSGVVEAVVAPRSEFINKTLKEAHFWEQFQVNPLAISRAEETFYTGLNDIKLRAGDTLVLHGTWERFNILQEHHNFIFTTPVSEVMKPDKALVAGFWLLTALVMIIVFEIQLSVCLMTGAFGMILFRVLNIDEAYQAVDWRTIFLLAGLIPLGIATQKTGTAAWIAHTVLNFVGDVPGVILLATIAILSTFFTLVVSNVGATVLLVPLVVNMAMTAGIDPRMAALVVGIATSNSFLLPTHQVNALYMGPGKYRTVDFMKAGGLMTIIFLAVMIAVMYLFYGI
ncbi:MAG: SLC13 family permease [Desulfonatronovibrionaceae bacterium]